MTHGKIFLSLLVNTLEKILYNTLHKLMGRYFLTNLGFFFFFCDESDKSVV